MLVASVTHTHTQQQQFTIVKYDNSDRESDNRKQKKKKKKQNKTEKQKLKKKKPGKDGRVSYYYFSDENKHTPERQSAKAKNTKQNRIMMIQYHAKMIFVVDK